MITREHLEARRAALIHQRDELLANANRVQGAVQLTEDLLKMLTPDAKSEPEAP